MRVTLAEDRDETEDQTRKVISVRVGADHSFGSELRRSVERGLEWKRCVLRRRKDLRLAVDGSGRRERNFGCSYRAHRFEHSRRGDGVLLEIALRVLEPVADIRVRLQVKDPI